MFQFKKCRISYGPIKSFFFKLQFSVSLNIASKQLQRRPISRKYLDASNYVLIP